MKGRVFKERVNRGVFVTIAELRERIGKKLAQTNFGVYITAHSYINECYEWYRSLIYESNYTLEEIREQIKDDDRKHRWDWLLARARATHTHCTHEELWEMFDYLTAEIEEYDKEEAEAARETEENAKQEQS